MMLMLGWYELKKTLAHFWTMTDYEGKKTSKNLVKEACPCSLVCIAGQTKPPNHTNDMSHPKWTADWMCLPPAGAARACIGASLAAPVPERLMTLSRNLTPLHHILFWNNCEHFLEKKCVAMLIFFQNRLSFTSFKMLWKHVDTKQNAKKEPPKLKTFPK